MTKIEGFTSGGKLRQLFQSESAGGMLLIVAAVLAIIMANTLFERIYTLLVDTPFTISLGSAGLSKPLLLWINDGLMAVFFLLVGLELKRELLEGELSDIKNITLPAVGAIGGMVVPAAIFVMFNKGDADALSGWAILIIAFFYTDSISTMALIISAICLAGLFLCNFRGVSSLRVYLLIGVILWLALKLRLTTLPKGMSLMSMYGVALLCGIGFTMSLFIGSLAFEQTGVNLLFDERLGIVVGSVLSAVAGYFVLSKSLPGCASIKNTVG